MGQGGHHMISRRQFLKAGLAAAACTLAPANLPIFAEPSGRKMNVLFIAVDDLRPELGCYGVKDMHTPNIDALAASGTLFDRAYCQQAVCSPTRTSLLTGRSPDTTRVYDLQTHFRKTIPNVVTLPEYFKQNGYHTQGLSKIYHSGLDDPQSWSVPHWDPKVNQYANRRDPGRCSGSEVAEPQGTGRGRDRQGPGERPQDRDASGGEAGPSAVSWGRRGNATMCPTTHSPTA